MDQPKIEYFSTDEQTEVDHLLGQYIHEHISLADFTRIYYSEENSKQKQHLTLRLIQSLINLLDTEEPLNIEKYRSLFSIKNKSEHFQIAQLLELIDPFVNPELDSFDQYWVKHRNICFVLVIVLCFLRVHKDDHLSVEPFSRVMNYSIGIVEKSDNLETKLYAVVAIANICLMFLDRRHQLTDCEQLRKLMKRLAIEENDPCPLGQLYQSMLECIQYQTAFQAHWCLELFAAAPGAKPAARLKLSPSRLSARNDDLFNLPSVHSPISVQTGAFYYEAILLTGGEMRIGWTSGPFCSATLGGDLYSIGLDGYNRVVWHNKTKSEIGSMRRWKCGDVLGCLIDFSHECFAFYLNGTPIGLHNIQLHFSTLPYFAAASLSVHQQCYFNFGQSPFKHPPPSRHFATLHSISAGSSHAYRLVESLALVRQSSIECCGSFGFHDGLQRQFDQLVTALETCVAKNDFEKLTTRLMATFDRLFLIPTGWHRLFQSIIELTGSQVSDYKLDVLVQFMIGKLDPIIVDPGGKRNSYSRTGSIQIRRISQEYSLMSLFAHYMSKQLPDVQKRNLFLILSFLTQRNFFTIHVDKWANELLHYAIKTLSEGAFGHELSCSTKLFLILCIDNLTANSSRPESLQHEHSLLLPQITINKLHNMGRRNELIQALKVLAGNAAHYNIFEETSQSGRTLLELQVSFCAAHYLRQLAISEDCYSLGGAPPVIKPVLNPEDSTGNVKLSLDGLSVRNDHYDALYWQSVRSMCAAQTGIYYYEVVILTSGPMRIGWATARCELLKLNAIGDDEHSIGFDGYNSVVVNDRVEYRVSNQSGRWEPGDTIGCLINWSKQKFTFYLNGAKLSLRWKPFRSKYFSTQPYYAAVSLYLHQQCCVNFGAAPFRFPPKRIDFSDFHTSCAVKYPLRVSHSIESSTACLLCKVERATLKFCSCDHWVLCVGCAPKLVGCPLCDK